MSSGLNVGAQLYDGKIAADKQHRSLFANDIEYSRLENPIDSPMNNYNLKVEFTSTPTYTDRSSGVTGVTSPPSSLKSVRFLDTLNQGTSNASCASSPVIISPGSCDPVDLKTRLRIHNGIVKSEIDRFPKSSSHSISDSSGIAALDTVSDRSVFPPQSSDCSMVSYYEDRTNKGRLGLKTLLSLLKGSTSSSLENVARKILSAKEIISCVHSTEENDEIISSQKSQSFSKEVLQLNKKSKLFYDQHDGMELFTTPLRIDSLNSTLSSIRHRSRSPFHSRESSALNYSPNSSIDTLSPGNQDSIDSRNSSRKPIDFKNIHAAGDNDSEASRSSLQIVMMLQSWLCKISPVADRNVSGTLQPLWNRSKAMMLHVHLMNISSDVSLKLRLTDLFGHEVWLRETIVKLVTTQVKSDVFRILGVYSGVMDGRNQNKGLSARVVTLRRGLYRLKRMAMTEKFFSRRFVSLLTDTRTSAPSSILCRNKNTGVVILKEIISAEKNTHPSSTKVTQRFGLTSMLLQNTKLLDNYQALSPFMRRTRATQFSVKNFLRLRFRHFYRILAYRSRLQRLVQMHRKSLLISVWTQLRDVYQRFCKIEIDRIREAVTNTAFRNKQLSLYRRRAIRAFKYFCNRQKNIRKVFRKFIARISTHCRLPLMAKAIYILQTGSLKHRCFEFWKRWTITQLPKNYWGSSIWVVTLPASLLNHGTNYSNTSGSSNNKNTANLSLSLANIQRSKISGVDLIIRAVVRKRCARSLRYWREQSLRQSIYRRGSGQISQKTNTTKFPYVSRRMAATIVAEVNFLRMFRHWNTTTVRITRLYFSFGEALRYQTKANCNYKLNRESDFALRSCSPLRNSGRSGSVPLDAVSYNKHRSSLRMREFFVQRPGKQFNYYNDNLFSPIGQSGTPAFKYAVVHFSGIFVSSVDSNDRRRPRKDFKDFPTSRQRLPWQITAFKSLDELESIDRKLSVAAHPYKLPSMWQMNKNPDYQHPQLYWVNATAMLLIALKKWRLKSVKLQQLRLAGSKLQTKHTLRVQYEKFYGWKKLVQGNQNRRLLMTLKGFRAIRKFSLCRRLNGCNHSSSSAHGSLMSRNSDRNNATLKIANMFLPRGYYLLNLANKATRFHLSMSLLSLIRKMRKMRSMKLLPVLGLIDASSRSKIATSDIRDFNFTNHTVMSHGTFHILGKFNRHSDIYDLIGESTVMTSRLEGRSFYGTGSQSRYLSASSNYARVKILLESTGLQEQYMFPRFTSNLSQNGKGNASFTATTALQHQKYRQTYRFALKVFTDRFIVRMKHKTFLKLFVHKAWRIRLRQVLEPIIKSAQKRLFLALSTNVIFRKQSKRLRRIWTKRYFLKWKCIKVAKSNRKWVLKLYFHNFKRLHRQFVCTKFWKRIRQNWSVESFAVWRQSTKRCKDLGVKLCSLHAFNLSQRSFCLWKANWKATSWKFQKDARKSLRYWRNVTKRKITIRRKLLHSTVRRWRRRVFCWKRFALNARRATKRIHSIQEQRTFCLWKLQLSQKKVKLINLGLNMATRIAVYFNRWKTVESIHHAGKNELLQVKSHSHNPFISHVLSEFKNKLSKSNQSMQALHSEIKQLSLQYLKLIVSSQSIHNWQFLCHSRIQGRSRAKCFRNSKLLGRGLAKLQVLASHNVRIRRKARREQWLYHLNSWKYRIDRYWIQPRYLSDLADRFHLTSLIHQGLKNLRAKVFQAWKHPRRSNLQQKYFNRRSLVMAMIRLKTIARSRPTRSIGLGNDKPQLKTAKLPTARHINTNDRFIAKSRGRFQMEQ